MNNAHIERIQNRREIHATKITEAVKQLCISACYYLPKDMYHALERSEHTEKSPTGKLIFADIRKNADIAREDEVPICQDTGISVIFIEIGQDVHIIGNLENAINEGVAQGYVEGYLRKSVVAEPLFDRINTKNNSPAIIHYKIISGDTLRITMAPKGAGSENKSILKMLIPADGIEGVKKVVLDAVLAAGPNSCPPMVVGVGIGGCMEVAALLAKRACVRSVDSKNQDPRYAQFEDELLEMINKTGIGPQGLGGSVTAIKVNVEYYPTHIAMLPVAVNINCHAARHASIEL